MSAVVIARGGVVSVAGLTAPYGNALVAAAAGFHRYGATPRSVARHARFWLQMHGAVPMRTAR